MRPACRRVGRLGAGGLGWVRRGTAAASSWAVGRGGAAWPQAGFGVSRVFKNPRGFTERKGGLRGEGCGGVGAGVVLPRSGVALFAVVTLRGWKNVLLFPHEKMISSAA